MSFLLLFSCVNGNVENQDLNSSQDAADKIVHDINNSIQPPSVKNERSGTAWSRQ